MNKLLSAEFVRLWKSFIFRLCVLFSLGISCYTVLMHWWYLKKDLEQYSQLDLYYCNVDSLLFGGGVYFIFALATFIGIFVGTEYSDGTIRNKLMVGHTRVTIYLSKLIVCGTAAVIFFSLDILCTLLLGSLLLGATTMRAATFMSFFFVYLFAALALTAFLLLLSMLIQSKATGCVVTLLTTLILLFSSIYVYSMLNAPEYFEGYMYIDEETQEVVTIEREKNTHYLTGTKRKVYQFLCDATPVCQLYRISGAVPELPDGFGLMPNYDAILIVLVTGIGIFIFTKRNLK